MKISDSSYISDLTKYPNIFKDTYWGQWKKSQFSEDRLKENIDNRNNFADEYKIKNYIPSHKYPLWVRNYVYDQSGNRKDKFDHIEVYRTEHKDHVLVISPYCRDQDKYFEDLEFKKIDPIYCFPAVSYVKYIYK
jgi:hypothetical protein